MTHGIKPTTYGIKKEEASQAVHSPKAAFDFKFVITIKKGKQNTNNNNATTPNCLKNTDAVFIEYPHQRITKWKCEAKENHV